MICKGGELTVWAFHPCFIYNSCWMACQEQAIFRLSWSSVENKLIQVFNKIAIIYSLSLFFFIFHDTISQLRQFPLNNALLLWKTLFSVKFTYLLFYRDVSIIIIDYNYKNADIPINTNNEQEELFMSSNTYQSSLDQETSILTILTVSEVAEYLGVGKNRIYELLNNQTLKGFRIGSTWKISRMALEEYIMNASKL